MSVAETIRVLLIEPGKHPRLVNVTGNQEMNALVQGWFSATYPWDDPVALVFDDDGKCKEGPLPNRMLEDYDLLVGPVFICGLGEEDFISITDELALKYAEKFWMPEAFLRTSKGLVVFRDDDGSVPTMEALLRGGADNGCV